jgi:hypothetical protein
MLRERVRGRLGRPRSAAPSSASLRALTAAALALPGLAHSPARAAPGDEAGFQYGRYEEGERQLFGVNSKFDPIRIDSLQGGAGLTFFDRLKFAFNYVQDTWSGATPITTAPLAFEGNRNPNKGVAVLSGASPFIDGTVLLDSRSRFSRLDENFSLVEEPRVVHTIATASPETRRQGDFKLGYEWDEGSLDVGGGLSPEDDYHTHFVSVNGRWDLNHKLSALNLGIGYSGSDIAALISDDGDPYIDSSLYARQIDFENLPDGSGVEKTLRGERQDWSGRIGWTQVLDRDSLFETSLGYTRSTGFLENPYKVVEFIFVDPDQAPGPFGERLADVRAVRENRPDTRNQLTWDARYVRYLEGLDAALHLDYHFYSDDWGVDAHTFEAAWHQPVSPGWTITPRVRYYSQGEAEFYRPFYLFKQAESLTPSTGGQDFSRIPVVHYASDYRLSGYGALSGGVTVEKRLAAGISFLAGFEYYTHQGGLKLGGAGEDDYADFDYYQVNAALRMALSPALFAAAVGKSTTHGGGISGNGGSGHAGDPHSGHAAHAPAGVMFDHMLHQAGDFMLGYRYMFHRMAGETLNGRSTASDAEIVGRGCGEFRCTQTALDHTMHMHMLDLMYAPSDWLNLMLMPQFTDMDMDLRELPALDDPGLPPAAPVEHVHGAGRGHGTGGVGDTVMAALVKLFDQPGHHLHLGLGVSAPTGEVDIRFSNIKEGNVGKDDEDGDGRNDRDDRFIHYGMQLGSGTWDLLPSLTYTGEGARWSWGGQLSGIYRLEDENESGYALGDQFQATAWGSYGLTDWLSASVRGVYTTQGEIKGRFNGPQALSMPMDFPANYGGRFWDVGVGLDAVVPIGDFAGNRLSVEWLQPIEDDANGFQLERDGALFATWSLKF